MPVCDPYAEKAKDKLQNKCNDKTGRWVKKSRDDVMDDLIACRAKAQERRERIKTAKRELRTLHKVQKMYYKLCNEHAMTKVQLQLLQRHVNVMGDKIPKKKAPRKKKAPMRDYTAAEASKMFEEAAERQQARFDNIIDKYESIWHEEFPELAPPVDLEAERDKEARANYKTPSVVHYPQVKRKPKAAKV